MSWAASPSSWTDDRDERLLALHGDGLTGAVIAERMGGGLSRSAVIARLRRLRARGDRRAGAARPNPVNAHVVRCADEMARLADAWADGAPTLTVAARAAGLTYDRAVALWAAIKADLGRQAA